MWGWSPLKNTCINPLAANRSLDIHLVVSRTCSCSVQATFPFATQAVVSKPCIGCTHWASFNMHVGPWRPLTCADHTMLHIAWQYMLAGQHNNLSQDDDEREGGGGGGGAHRNTMATSSLAPVFHSLASSGLPFAAVCYRPVSSLLVILPGWCMTIRSSPIIPPLPSLLLPGIVLLPLR